MANEKCADFNNKKELLEYLIAGGHILNIEDEEIVYLCDNGDYANTTGEQVVYDFSNYKIWFKRLGAK